MIISRTTHAPDTDSTFTDIISISGGPFVARGDTYGATDGPEGPSMAAILGPGDLFWGDHQWHGRTEKAQL